MPCATTSITPETWYEIHWTMVLCGIHTIVQWNGVRASGVIKRTLEKENMDSLVQLTIDAHGGLERWRSFEHVSARLRNGDVLWALKQQQGALDRSMSTSGSDRARECQPSSGGQGHGAI
jgi:hypothetical protein